MWLTLAAMRNAIAVLMASLAIVLLGMTSINRISIDLFPNINFPQIQVGTVYKGASAQDIERSVTYPLEKAVSAVANVKHVESRSRQGFSLVIVQFVWGTDIDAALTEVVQRINQIINTLPPGVQQPFIVKSDLSNIPVCVVTVSGGGLDERALYDLAYNTIEPQFERLSGVASASVDGGKIRQITINLDRDRLYSKGLSVNEVTKSVNDANFLLPSGDVKVGSFDYNVFTNNQFSVVEPMEDIIVRRTGTTPIRLRDIGRVEDSAETQVSIVRVNGERSVFLRINKQPGANTVEVVDAVRATVPKLLGVPPGVNVNLSFDQSTYIRQSIESLWHEAAMGSILAFLVILVFLRSFVSTIIISIAIPLSLLLTLIAMYFLGQTLNIFTLGGLALAVGRLVDDSIVELENINRHLDMPGKPRRKAVLDAAREVAMPIFVSTITTIVVFLPTVFLEGQSRLLFIPLTFTISFSLFASFLVSRTVTPLLCLQWLKSEHEMTEHRSLRGRFDRLFVWSGKIFQRLDAWYQRCLEWSLDHRRALIGGILAMSASAVVIYLIPNAVGTEFFPASDESQFRLQVRAPVGTRVEETERIVKRMEDVIRSTARPGEIKTIVSSIGVPGGRSGLFSQNTGPHAAQLQVYLSDPDKRTRKDKQIFAEIGPKLGGQSPGTIFTIQFGGIVSRVINSGAQQPIEIEQLGYDLRDARDTARQVVRSIQDVPGVTFPFISREENYPQFDIVVDREKAAMAGLSQRDIAQAALISLNSNVSLNPSIFTDPRTGNQYNVVVQLDEPFRTTSEDLSRLFVMGEGGRPVLLGAVAEVKQGVGPVMIERKYQQRLIKINAQPAADRDLGAIAQDIEDNLKALPVPPGFTFQMGGQIQQQREAFGSLKFTSALAIVLVYMVMASQFRSLLDPFIIMFSVPLGMIGVVWALFLTRTTLNVTSFMGIIMMVGIVVSNGVLLVEYMNELRRQGLPLREAVVRGGRTRLRPILMTSLTTLVGLLPMALGIGTGSEANAPLARAVIGGLAVSTVLTLLFIPTLYVILEERFPRRMEDAAQLSLQGETA
ncbi:MAG TPA: efflux RND transporter permease subunit [Methylomirabilota bacterium]|jgi:hydrophobe/amphiphile efflux-1 (HAE1) family protein|nr:efflux RND transporter permease subunit [Methylomirabilota bacterium]